MLTLCGGGGPVLQPGERGLLQDGGANGWDSVGTRICQDQECSTHVSAAEVDYKEAESNDCIYS